MDSDHPLPSRLKNQRTKAEPKKEGAEEQKSLSRPAMPSFEEDSTHKNDLMTRLSIALRKNSFMASKIQALEKQNIFLSEKSCLLENKLSQKNQTAEKESSSDQKPAQPIIIETAPQAHEKEQALKDKIAGLENQILDEQNKHKEMILQTESEHEKQLSYLQKMFEQKDEEITNLKPKYEEKIKKIQDKYQKALAQSLHEREQFLKELTEQNKKNLSTEQAQHEQKIHKNEQKHKKALENIKNSYEDYIDTLNNKHETQMTEKEEVGKQRLKELDKRQEEEVKNLREEYAKNLTKKEMQTESAQSQYKKLKSSWDALIQKKEKEFLSEKAVDFQKIKAGFSAQVEKHKREINQIKEQLNEKEAVIVDLNREIEKITENYMNNEKEIQQKMEGRWEQKITNLREQNEEEMQKQKQHYEMKLAGFEEKKSAYINEIKQKYAMDYQKKSEELEQRMIELKEEQDDYIHNLRAEMENELIAERRKSTALNNEDRQDLLKVQKDFQEVDSALKMKSFKLDQIIEQKNQIELELEHLRKTNKELKERNTSLQTLWENSWPEMQKQKQQIASLQALNKQLSEELQKNYYSAPAEESSSDLKKSEWDLNSALEELHLHKN